MDEEEALAECALIFSRRIRQYEGKVDNPKWFMSLFTRAVANDFITFSTISTRNREAVEQYIEENSRKQSELDYSNGPLSLALREGSDELKAVLKTIINAPTEFMQILLAIGPEEKWNRRLCRLSGISNPGSIDVLNELKSLLGESA